MQGLGNRGTDRLPSGASAPHKLRAIPRFLVLAFALVLCLVAPSVARANGSDTTTTVGDTQTTTDTTSSTPAPADTSSSQTSTTQASSPAPAANTAPDAAPQTNGNGNANGSGNNAAPMPAVSPDPAPPVAAANTPTSDTDNGGNVPNGNATGQNEASPVSTTSIPADSPGNSDHSGNANANADSKQDKPKNVNVDVKVGNPGNNGAVVQGNDSTAAAAAGASGGSGSGSGAGNNTNLSSAGTPDTDAAPNGNVPPAASQADSTSGETPPVANSPPCGPPSIELSGTTDGSTNAAAAAGQLPTVSGTTPSASCVNGALNGGQTAAASGANGLSGNEATGVTPASASENGPDGAEATDVTGNDPVVDVTLPDGSSGSDVTVNVGDPGTETPVTDPSLTVDLTAPMPQGTTSSNNANADASSTQVSPENVNASVRVLSPGANGPVDQTNSSSATAAAGATGPDGETTSNNATPTATSTQVAPINVNVSVRVGSPGDNAPVSQANTSGATAATVDPATVEPVLAELPEEEPNSYADVENSSGIIQGIAQCADDEADCIASPGSSADATTGGLTTSAPDLSSATATQDAPSNVSVSIRVASPGQDGFVSQLNDANASGATAVNTTTDPDNLVVGISVPGNPASVVVPTDPNTPWIWNWNWTTGTAPTDPSQTPFDSPNWNWDWTVPTGAAPGPASGTSPDAPAPTPGQWTWTWVWTRGDGWTTTWTYTQACDCSWTWVWTWTWPADTPSTPQNASAPAQVPAPPSDPQVSQQNESIVAAAAITSFEGDQTVGLTTDGDPMDATRYQGITSSQSATAFADALQADPANWSVVTAGRLDSVAQKNRAVATAAAGVFDTSTQTIDQTQAGTHDGADHTVTGIQVITTAQAATADSTAMQTRVTNLNHVWSATPGNHARIGAVTQTNEAVNVTYADGWSFVTQRTDQSQLGGGADQNALAVQIASISQTAFATSSVAQSDLRNRTSIEIPWNGLWNPPIDQSHLIGAGSIATNYSEITQSILQEASGEDIGWNQTATQTATVKQGGSASSSASQAFKENVAHWNGTLWWPAPPVSSGGQVVGGGGISGAAVEVQPGLISGSPPLVPVTAVAGTVRVIVFSATGRTAWTPHAGSTAGDAGGHAPARAAPVGGGTTSTNAYHHALLNLLGATTRALLLLLGSTPFAALLALFTIAALSVARLQCPALALGRSADFARRERPG